MIRLPPKLKLCSIARPLESDITRFPDRQVVLRKHGRLLHGSVSVASNLK